MVVRRTKLIPRVPPGLLRPTAPIRFLPGSGLRQKAARGSRGGTISALEIPRSGGSRAVMARDHPNSVKPADEWLRSPPDPRPPSQGFDRAFPVQNPCPPHRRSPLQGFTIGRMVCEVAIDHKSWPRIATFTTTQGQDPIRPCHTSQLARYHQSAQRLGRRTED